MSRGENHTLNKLNFDTYVSETVRQTASESPVIIVVLLGHSLLPRKQRVSQTVAQAWSWRVAAAAVGSVQTHAGVTRLKAGRLLSSSWTLRRGQRLVLAVGCRRGWWGWPRSRNRRRGLLLFLNICRRYPRLLVTTLGKPPSWR